MFLIPKEELILSGDNDIVILTNLRIRKTNKEFGLLYTIEFFLEDISSVELSAQSSPLLLVLAGLCAFVGLFLLVDPSRGASGGAAAFMLIVGAVLVLLWASSRQRQIKITSSGGRSMGFDVRKLDPGKVQELLDKVQGAKSARMDYLRGS